MEKDVKIFYCNIAWANQYVGNQYDNPKGNWGYTKEHIGHETYNFKDYNGFYYGFVQKNQGATIKIDKIDKAAKGCEKIENVLVVWVSRKPKENGQYIVGWYNNATVYREYQKVPAEVAKEREKGYDTYIIKSNNAVLLSEDERVAFKESLYGIIGRYYGFDEEKKIYDETLDLIRNYEAKNRNAK